MLTIFEVNSVADIQINNPGDFDPNDNVVTIREAVFLANQFNDADTIQFDPAVFGPGLEDRIVLTQGQLQIVNPVTIDGPGWDRVTIDASGSTNSGVLNVSHFQGLVTIDGVTITGGDIALGNGAGISHGGGDLTIRDTVIRDNHGDFFSAAGLSSTLRADDDLLLDRVVLLANTSDLGPAAFRITNDGGRLEIRDSLIIENVTGEPGPQGGVEDESFGLALFDLSDSSESRIVNTTFASNTNYRGNGGALRVDSLGGSSLEIVNSTFSGNAANGGGGAIAVFGAGVSINHTTITNNIIGIKGPITTGGSFNPSGGGLLVQSESSASVSHSIIAQNIDRSALGIPDDLGHFNFAPTPTNPVTYGVNHSIVSFLDLSKESLSGGIGAGGTNQLTDPLLEPLDYNFGEVAPGIPMLTHRPLAISPAIDAGDPNITPADPPEFAFELPADQQQTDILYDQRGAPFDRVVDVFAGGAQIDIGAIEYRPNLDALAPGFAAPVPTGETATIFLDFERADGPIQLAAEQLGRGPFTPAQLQEIRDGVTAEVARIYERFAGVTVTQVRPTVEPYDVVIFHAGFLPGVFGSSAGFFGDYRNRFTGDISQVFPNQFHLSLDDPSLGHVGGGAPDQALIDDLIQSLAGTAAHEHAHTAGLQHYDAYGDPLIAPSNTQDAQNQYLLATGSTGLTDAGRVAQRELSPLSTGKYEFSYGLTGQTVAAIDAKSDAELGGSNSANPQALAFDPLSLVTGAAAGLGTANVVGALASAGESDWYSVAAAAGDLLTVNALSAQVERHPDPFIRFDVGVRVYRASDMALLATSDDIAYTFTQYGEASQLLGQPDFTDYAGPFDDAMALNVGLATAGDYLIEVFGGVGDYELFTTKTGVDPGPLQVMNLTISGSLSNHPDYSFDTVVGSGAQLNTVPVGVADTIEIEFNRAIDVSTQAKMDQAEEALTLFGSNTQNRPTRTGFFWDAATNTGKWTFTGWTFGDRYAIRLSDIVTDEASNALDGEWVNPLNETITVTQGQNLGVSTFPSGDGAPGGDFVFVATILPGDTDLDGDVDLVDLDTLGANFGATMVNDFFSGGDFDGDGEVGIVDLDALGANFLANLQGAIMLLADIAGSDNIVDSADAAEFVVLGDFDMDEDIDQDDLDFFFGWLGFQGVG